MSYYAIRSTGEDAMPERLLVFDFKQQRDAYVRQHVGCRAASPQEASAMKHFDADIYHMPHPNRLSQ